MLVFHLIVLHPEACPTSGDREGRSLCKAVALDRRSVASNFVGALWHLH